MLINNHRVTNIKIKWDSNHNIINIIKEVINNMEWFNNKQQLKLLAKFYKKYVQFQHVMVHKQLLTFIMLHKCMMKQYNFLRINKCFKNFFNMLIKLIMKTIPKYMNM